MIVPIIIGVAILIIVIGYVMIKGKPDKRRIKEGGNPPPPEGL